MEKFRWMELSSRQFKRYIMEGGDTAALPIGSMEVMGPHLPIGSKMIICKAVAEALCRAQGGLCLPPMPASPIYDEPFEAGSMHVDNQITLDYVQDAVNEALANGIRRMVLVSYYSELYYTIHEYFQQHDIGILYINPESIKIPGARDSHCQYNALLAGSLKLLGEDELLERVLRANDECLKQGGYVCPQEEEPLKTLLLTGVFTHTYKPGEYAVLPSEGLDAPGAANAITEWAQAQGEAFKAFGEYNHVLSRTRYDRGLRQGGYGYVE